MLIVQTIYADLHVQKTFFLTYQTISPYVMQ